MRGHHTSWSGEVHRSESIMRLSQLWWAVRVGVWLCGLSIRWRVHSLPQLLHHLTPVRGRAPRSSRLELEQAVRIVRRICRLRLFHGPLFPQACLRQSLALYYILTRLRYPFEIHFGVYKAGEALRGHSWVTVDGRAVAERIPPQALQAIYSFPEVSSRVSLV
jgi:hypothetical protein